MIKRSKGLKNYYRKKNPYSGLTFFKRRDFRRKSVNEDIARVKIYKIFDLYFDDKIEGIRETIPLLKKEIKSLEFLYRKLSKSDSYVSRTFDFSDEEKNISELVYISDRWACPSRLDWLIQYLKEQ